MSHQLVSTDRSRKIVQEQDHEDTTASEVLGAEERESSSLVIAKLTYQTVPLLAKAVQTDDQELPPKEFKYLSKSRRNSGMHLITTKAKAQRKRRTGDRVYMDRDIDLGSLPVTKFPPLSPTRVNLVTMKANTTDADMFREYPVSHSNMVSQAVCSLEMDLMIPNLSL